MMKSSELKTILYNKLQAEQTSFKKSDISIKKVKHHYIITIKDFKHIQFKLAFEYDDFFGFIVWVSDNNYNTIAEVVSLKEYDITTALNELGYYIASRF